LLSVVVEESEELLLVLSSFVVEVFFVGLSADALSVGLSVAVEPEPLDDLLL
jgi:hypothetical protein